VFALRLRVGGNVGSATPNSAYPDLLFCVFDREIVIGDAEEGTRDRFQRRPVLVEVPPLQVAICHSPSAALPKKISGLMEVKTNC
jgi:hypothetical protein